jgi:hypothetical protein
MGDPGDSITTGQTASADSRADAVPDSGSLGLLALGGAGLLASCGLARPGVGNALTLLWLIDLDAAFSRSVGWDLWRSSIGIAHV